jgi:hypothetical protein
MDDDVNLFISMLAKEGKSAYFIKEYRHFHFFVLNQSKSSLCVYGHLKRTSSFSCFVISTGIAETCAILTAIMFHCVPSSAVSALYSRWPYPQNLQIPTVPTNAHFYYYVFHS